MSLQSRPVSAPRVPQHSYSMSSLKRYPAQSAQFYLARSESRWVACHPPPPPLFQLYLRGVFKPIY